MSHAQIPDDDFIQALEQALNDGHRLPGRGGVSRHRIAEYCGCRPSTVRERMLDLQDSGEVTRVLGISDSSGFVWSWLPSHHPDARQAGERDHAPEVTE